MNTYEQKMSKTEYLIEFKPTFVHVYSWFVQKKNFSKIVEKLTILSAKSPKHDKQPNFFIKDKMLRMCDFHIDFQFRA